MFGSGDLFTSSQGGLNFQSLTPKSPQAPGKQGGRQEEKMSCLPVTVRSIESSVAQAAQDGEIRFFGEEQAMLVVVGFAETVVSQAASMELSVNDATGRIKVRHYMVDKNPELDGIKPGCYVSLVGQVRTSPEPHFAAQSIIPVKSADEISYHMIEATHAALKLQRGRGNDPMTPAPKKAAPAVQASDAMAVDTPQKLLPGQTAEEAAAAPVAQAAAPAGPVKGALQGDALREALLAYIKKEGEGKSEGLHLDAIKGHFAGTGVEAVRAGLAQLVDDGELYNTISDEHWAELA